MKHTYEILGLEDNKDRAKIFDSLSALTGVLSVEISFSSPVIVVEMHHHIMKEHALQLIHVVVQIQ